MPPKYRIPRMAVAALALGACGDDSGGVDVSASRIRSVAESYCKQYARCYPEEFSESYELADCIAATEEVLDYYAEAEECLDAYLDYFECSAKLSCDEDEDEACAAQVDAADELCSEASEEYLTRSPQPAPFKGFRIPR